VQSPRRATRHVFLDSISGRCSASDTKEYQHGHHRDSRPKPEDEAHGARATSRVRSRRAGKQRGRRPGATPHEIYDSALGACKALTTLWYARRKQIPVEDIRVTVTHDDSEERKGIYRLHATLGLTGALTDAQRQELLAVADKCPVHKLMTQVSTEVVTELAPSGP